MASNLGSTSSSSKQPSKSNDGSNPSRKKQKIENSTTVDSSSYFYFTNGRDPVVNQWADGKFIIGIRYNPRPDRNITKSNKLQFARSVDSKFHSNQSTIPSIFDSKEDAMSYMTEFCLHVENTLIGDNSSPRLYQLRQKILTA